MFSFMKIATFAALAFGTLASAIPSPAPILTVEEGALVERKTTSNVAIVLANLTVHVTPLCLKLTELTATSATPANTTAIIDQIKVVLEEAVEILKGVATLGSSIGDILQLLAAIIKLLITSINHVVSVCLDKDVILQIVKLVDGPLAALISAILGLVGGGGILSSVIAQLVGLLGSIIQTLLSLNFTACEQVLLIL
ncbi:unnamed protein product [Peniophora sp. CBMAI 1063]|nr:unnamed protein product [Peniophora sp. CBMAI 1063]